MEIQTVTFPILKHQEFSIKSNNNNIRDNYHSAYEDYLHITIWQILMFLCDISFLRQLTKDLFIELIYKNQYFCCNETHIFPIKRYFMNLFTLCKGKSIKQVRILRKKGVKGLRSHIKAVKR